MKKYELILDDSIKVLDCKLFRIRALTDLGTVKAGDLGGYIQSEKNLSHYGSAWVYGNAKVSGDANVSYNASVYGNAKVSDNAKVSYHARVCGYAKVYGNARVCGYAEVYDNAKVSGDAKIISQKDYIVFKNSWSSFRWFTYTKSNKMWKVGCFYGTGQELIEKAYADSENSGNHYKAYVDLVETLDKLSEQEDK